MGLNHREQRRFTSIWHRAGGFASYGDGSFELHGKITPEIIKSERHHKYANFCQKYPNRAERRWWTRMANDPNSGARF